MLAAGTAADLMTANPLSIQESASIREAVGFLTDKGFSAAPVIDRAGRPVGVVSRADILIHDREKVDYLEPKPEFFEEAELHTQSGEALKGGFQVERIDRACVRDIMTPVVFSVTPETPAARVVEQMVALKVHRLFVVGRDGVLVGVISTLDLVRNLIPEPEPAAAPPARSRSGTLAFKAR
jgi:CBS domain-containing protein